MGQVGPRWAKIAPKLFQQSSKILRDGQRSFSFVLRMVSQKCDRTFYRKGCLAASKVAVAVAVAVADAAAVAVAVAAAVLLLFRYLSNGGDPFHYRYKHMNTCRYSIV